MAIASGTEPDTLRQVDTEHVIATLAGLLDPSSGPFLAAEASARRLPPDYRDSTIDYELGRAISPTLAGQPEFGRSLLLNRQTGSRSFQPQEAGELLVGKARRTGSAAVAVAWLQKVLATKQASGICVMALWGVPCSFRSSLGRGVELLPFKDIPDSQEKALVARSFDMTSHVEVLPPATAFWGVPEAALTCGVVIAPFLEEARDEPRRSPGDAHAPFARLDEVRRMLTIVGPSLPIPAASWFQFDDRELAEADRAASVARGHLEVSPLFVKSFGTFDPVTAREVLDAYSSLSGGMKRKVELPRFGGQI